MSALVMSASSIAAETDETDEFSLYFPDSHQKPRKIYNHLVSRWGKPYLRIMMGMFRIIFDDQPSPVLAKLTCGIYGIGSGGGAEPEIMNYCKTFVDFTTTDIAPGSFKTGQSLVTPDFPTLQEAEATLGIKFDMMLMNYPFPSGSSCSCKSLQEEQLNKRRLSGELSSLQAYSLYRQIKYGECESDCVSVCNDLQTLKEVLPKYAIISFEQTGTSGTQELIDYIYRCGEDEDEDEDEEEEDENGEKIKPTEYQVMSKEELSTRDFGGYLCYTIALLKLK